MSKTFRCPECGKPMEPPVSLYRCTADADHSMVGPPVPEEIAFLESELAKAIHIARDLITWAKVSDVKASAVLDAETRLARIMGGGT